MTSRRALRLLPVLGLFLALLAACAPAASPTIAPAPTQASILKTQPEPSSETAESKTPTAAGQPTPAPVEGRQVELEWPEHLRLGDSDVIRLSLTPTRAGYIARAEFPDHSLQTREVPVPRPDGYILYAAARLDGVGFDLAPGGDQEQFVPEGEEIAWRWTLTPRKPGQQRLSVQLRLRWVPAAGTTGNPRESQVFSRGLDVQVSSFLGLSPTQAGLGGLLGLLFGGGCLLTAVTWRDARRGTENPPAGRQTAMQTVSPDPALQIETPGELSLSADESGLLSGMFGHYARVIILHEFLSGYSGARTFLIQPIRPDGCADAPTIVKLGSREASRQEFDHYEAYIKDRLPPMTARIQRSPVTLSGRDQPGKRAALQYTFIAEPGRPPLSLRQALLQTPDPAYLLQLFNTFGPHLWMQRHPYTFRLGCEYDRLLPPHYVLEPSPGERGQFTLDENSTPTGLTLAAGQIVTLQPFHQKELRADGQSFSLVGAPGEGRPALRLRWLNGNLPVRPTAARVTATRMDLLHDWTAHFDRFGLPDPLDCLQDTLEETIRGTRSVIHGDLNLENVLVGPGSLVWLIDFAQTCEGHPLFDFAHLESELIAHILAAQAGSPRAYLDLWQSGNHPLLNTLHQIAGRCLFDPAQPREYDLALYLACLGALKYQNISETSRHCLYLTAAGLSQDLFHK